MKPARSLLSTVCFSSCFPANASARSTVSGDVSRLGTSSTSGSTGTGLKKCMPMTRWGWGVTAASFMIGIDDVLLASRASGRTTLPSAWKMATFSASSSTTASITRSRSASSATSVAVRSRPSAASRSAADSLPDFSARASDLRMRASAGVRRGVADLAAGSPRSRCARPPPRSRSP